MSFRYNTRQTKGKEPVTQQPGAKKTSKDSLGKVTSEVTVQAKSYVTKPVQATGVKDTSRASASSQPKRPSQPSVATENASLRDKVASLETELQESNDKVRDLEANLERKGEREKEEALKVTDLESELQKSNDKVKDLETNVERIQREKEDALREERESTKIDKAALQNHIRTLQQEKDNLEGKFDAAKKAKGEEDKKELESELERMKNELEKLRRDKDQEIKNFEKLQQTLEQTEIKMGELNDRHDKVDKDRREIVAERNKLEGEKERLEVLLEREKTESKKGKMLVKEVKDVREQLEKEKIEKVKHMEELENARKELEKFYKERDQQQTVGLLQKPSSEVDEEAFLSCDSNSPKSSPKVPRSDTFEQHKRMHQQSVETLVGSLKNRDHGSTEDSIPHDWVYVPEEVGIDHKQGKTTDAELKPKEVIAQLKEQLSKQNNEAQKQQEEIAQLTEQLSKPSNEVRRQQREIARLKDKLEREGKEKEALKHEIQKKAENDENLSLKRQIHELQRDISEKGLLIKQLQTHQAKPSDFLQPTAPDAQPRSLGEMSTRGKVPTVKRQQSYEAAVSIRVSPPELTESALHSSLEKQSPQQSTQMQIDGRATPVQQDFNVTIVENLRKQLETSRKEVESLRREKEPNSEVETLRRDLEDARGTIDNLQDDLMMTMEKYTKVMAESKTLHEEKEKRLKDITEWDRNRQDSVRKQEEISKLEGKVEDLEEEVEARKQHEQKLMGQIKRDEEEKKYLEDVVAQVKQRAEAAEKSRQGLKDENLTFKQIIDQFQSDFNQERKDREGAAGRFADQEKQWMEQIRKTNEERDRLKAVSTHLQEETVALKHEAERIKRESDGIVDGLDKKLAFQENTIKKQEAANRKQETEHKKREAALQKQIERLNQEVSKLRAGLADKHKDREGAKTLGDAYQRLHGEKVEIEHQLNTAMETHKLTTQHIRELVQENQHLKASNEDARRHVGQTTGEIQSLQEQYRVLSIQFAKMRDENQRLRNRSASQTQVPPQMRVAEEESSYQSLPQGLSASRQKRPHTNESEFTRSERIYREQDNAGLHPQHGDWQRQVFSDRQNSQYNQSQQRPVQPHPHNDLSHPQHDHSHPQHTQARPQYDQSRLQYEQSHQQYAQQRLQNDQPPPQHDQSHPHYGQTHPVYGDNQKWQQEQRVVRTAQTCSPENDLTEKDSPPNSTQSVGQDQYLLQSSQAGPQRVAKTHYSPSHTVPGVPAATGAGRGVLALSNQQWHTAPPTSLPRSHSTPDRQDSDRSSDSVLPSPMSRPPPLDSFSSQPSIPADHGYGDKRIDVDMQLQSIPSGPDSSFQADKRYIGDRINREIEHEAKKYIEGQQKGVPVADEVDEELWPYDPNLVCPHCGKRFRHGQIREFRYHIDDEH